MMILIAALFFSQPASADTVVTKEAFVESMKTALPTLFCSEKRYFRKCFKVTEDECIKEAMRATKVCLISMQDELPAKLHQPDDGKKWGEKIGNCAGTSYDVSMTKSKIDLPDCKDPSKWK